MKYLATNDSFLSLFARGTNGKWCTKWNDQIRKTIAFEIYFSISLLPCITFDGHCEYLNLYKTKHLKYILSPTWAGKGLAFTDKILLGNNSAKTRLKFMNKGERKSMHGWTFEQSQFCWLWLKKMWEGENGWEWAEKNWMKCLESWSTTKVVPAEWTGEVFQRLRKTPPFGDDNFLIKVFLKYFVVSFWDNSFEHAMPLNFRAWNVIKRSILVGLFIFSEGWINISPLHVLGVGFCTLINTHGRQFLVSLH